MALRKRYLLANIGDQYMRLDWDTFEPLSDKEFVDEYVEGWEDFLHHGYGVEFGGPLGVGKTFAATHIGKEMIKRNQSVFFVRFIDMVFSFEKDDDDLERRMRESTFLIIDEILPPNTSKEAAVFASHFEAMIRYRTDFDLPTIITTNLTVDELEKAYPRVYSLLAAKQVRKEFTGDDVRRSKMSQENLNMILNKEKRPIT